MSTWRVWRGDMSGGEVQPAWTGAAGGAFGRRPWAHQRVLREADHHRLALELGLIAALDRPLRPYHQRGAHVVVRAQRQEAVLLQLRLAERLEAARAVRSERKVQTAARRVVRRVEH
eukprot:3363151-Prymnesium_polylepis.2